jgi:uncharacterized membrane protein
VSVSAAPPRRRVDWGRAEFVLTLLGFVGFLTLPIQIGTAYSGLPFHPLILHVPVVLIPVTILAAIVVMVRLDWFGRSGIPLAVVSIVAMSSIFLTMRAGSVLRAELHLQGRAAQLIQEHSHAANLLAIAYVLFTACVIVTFAALRISGGRPTGLAIVDRPLTPRATLQALRALLVVLAVVCGLFVFRVGDLGAKAVWQGRLQAAGPHASLSGSGPSPARR